jgi:hypothetical protein
MGLDVDLTNFDASWTGISGTAGASSLYAPPLSQDQFYDAVVREICLQARVTPPDVAGVRTFNVVDNAKAAQVRSATRNVAVNPAFARVGVGVIDAVKLFRLTLSGMVLHLDRGVFV